MELMDEIKRALDVYERSQKVSGDFGIDDIKDNAPEWLRYLIGEVERLQRVTKGVGLLAQGNSDLTSKNHTLHYRVEELQKALKEITSYTNPTGEDGKEMIVIAREALKGENPNEQ